MADMAKVQQAGAAASIGHGNRSMKTQALNSRRRTGVLKNGAVFSQTVGTEIWIKDANVFVVRVALQGSFAIDLENSQHFFLAK